MGTASALDERRQHIMTAALNIAWRRAALKRRKHQRLPGITRRICRENIAAGKARRNHLAISLRNRQSLHNGAMSQGRYQAP